MLITVEGIDGSGKSSVVGALMEDYPEVVFTKEPTESWYGEAVRRSIVDDGADSLAELFLYMADHAAHLSSTVNPALADGRVVVSDRFSDSRYAYQGAALADRFADPVGFVQRVHKPWTVVPDKTIYVDVDPAVGAERSGASNKFEQAAFLAEVQNRYEQLILSDPERFIEIDGMQSEEAVIAEVKAVVAEIIE